MNYNNFSKKKNTCKIIKKKQLLFKKKTQIQKIKEKGINWNITKIKKTYKKT
jgi:hypothetical protein